MANLGLGASKIMIHKAMEFSREASNMLKSAEQGQAFAQKMVNAQSAARQKSVQDVNKSEAAVISRDNSRKRDRDNSQSGSSQAEANAEADEKIIAQADVGTEKRLIDIRI